VYRNVLEYRINLRLKTASSLSVLLFLIYKYSPSQSRSGTYHIEKYTILPMRISVRLLRPKK